MACRTKQNQPSSNFSMVNIQKDQCVHATWRVIPWKLTLQSILGHVCLCLCTLLDHTCLTEHYKKMGSLTQCPITFVLLHRSLPNLCECRLCNTLLHTLKKTVWLWKQTSSHLWKRDFDCVNLNKKFQYWSCSDIRCNWKNPVVVLKELTEW